MNQGQELLAWAYTVVKKEVEEKSFGTISICMANGVISGIKIDKHHKAPSSVDK